MAEEKRTETVDQPTDQPRDQQPGGPDEQPADPSWVRPSGEQHASGKTEQTPEATPKEDEQGLAQSKDARKNDHTAFERVFDLLGIDVLPPPKGRASPLGRTPESRAAGPDSGNPWYITGPIGAMVAATVAFGLVVNGIMVQNVHGSAGTVLIGMALLSPVFGGAAAGAATNRLPHHRAAAGVVAAVAFTTAVVFVFFGLVTPPVPAYALVGIVGVFGAAAGVVGGRLSDHWGR